MSDPSKKLPLYDLGAPPPAGTPVAVRWDFDSRLEQAHGAAARLRDFCREHGVDAQRSLALELSLYEAFANAVEHGYRHQAGHPIRVAVMLDGAELTLLVCQRDVPLAPAVVAAAPVGFQDLPVAPALADVALRGRGLRIIKASVGRCTVQRDGDWHCLAMHQPLR